MSSSDFLIQKKLDSTFLSTFKRPNINYPDQDVALLEAYRSGIYDATMNFSGESTLKITGTSQTMEDVKKFFRQMSFNGDLTLKINKDTPIKTVPDQEILVDTWFKDSGNKSGYTQLILMIPKDNDRTKLSKIVYDFLGQQFDDFNHAYVEHTDTDIFHYHVIVEKSFSDDLLLKLRSDFISLCIGYGVKLL